MNKIQMFATLALIASQAEVLTAKAATDVEKAQIDRIISAMSVSNTCASGYTNSTYGYDKVCVDLTVANTVRALDAFANDPSGRTTRALKSIQKCSTIYTSSTYFYEKTCSDALLANAAADIGDLKADLNPIKWSKAKALDPNQVNAILTSVRSIKDCGTIYTQSRYYYEEACLKGVINQSSNFFYAFIVDNDDYVRDLSESLQCETGYASSKNGYLKTCVDRLVTTVSNNLSDLAEPALNRAVLKDDILTISALLLAGENVNGKNLKGETPLYLAIKKGFSDAVAVLLKSDKIDVNLKAGEEGVFPIEQAYKNSDLLLATDLVAKGAKVLWWENGDSFLHVAISDKKPGFAQLFTNAKTVNAANKEGVTPFALAFKTNQVGIAKDLIASGAVTKKTANVPGSFSVLAVALSQGNLEWVDFLLENGSTYAEVSQETDETPLTSAIKSGSKPSVVRIIEMDKNLVIQVNKKAESPLTLATSKDNAEFVSVLLANAANAGQQDQGKDSVLSISLKRATYGIATQLVNAGAALNVANLDGSTPLAIVSVVADVATPAFALTQLMLKKGANTEFVGKENGLTVLAQAIAARKVDAAFLLLSNGANPNGFAGKTTNLLNAIRMNMTELAIELIAKGASVDKSIADVEAPIMAALSSGNKKVTEALINAGADLSVMNAKGETIVMMAIRSNDADMLKLLGPKLNKKAVNTADSSGFTPLMLATQVQSKMIISLLLKAEADVNAADLNGNTSLSIAVVQQNMELVQMLLDAGAKAKAKNGGFSAVDVAKKQVHGQTILTKPWFKAMKIAKLVKKSKV